MVEAAGERPLGIGVVGCGSVALSMHLNGWTRLAEKARIVALCDSVPGRAERFAALVREAYAARSFEDELRAAQRAQRGHDAAGAERLRRRGGAARAAAAPPRVHADLEALLRDAEVDVVAVCTPHHLHAPLSALALEAGRHVFSEGPLAVNLEQADRAIAAWHRSGKQYTAQFYTRYFRGARQAYRLARSGRLGQVLIARGDSLWWRDQAYYDNDAWRGTRAAGDRVFVHQGRYAMDLLLWILEDTVEEVYAYGGTMTHSIEVEDNAAVQVRFASGAYGQLVLSNSARAPGYGRDVERVRGAGGAGVAGRRPELRHRGVRPGHQLARAGLRRRVACSGRRRAADASGRRDDTLRGVRRRRSRRAAGADLAPEPAPAGGAQPGHRPLARGAAPGAPALQARRPLLRAGGRIRRLDLPALCLHRRDRARLRGGRPGLCRIRRAPRLGSWPGERIHHSGRLWGGKTLSTWHSRSHRAPSGAADEGRHGGTTAERAAVPARRSPTPHLQSRGDRPWREAQGADRAGHAPLASRWV